MIDGESRALAYLPRLAVEQLIAGVEGPTAITGAVLFADVSGFSRIAAVLAERGHRGAELLTELLNACFGRLIEVLESHGGQVLDFVGDAVLALWPATPEHGPQRALARATVAALAIQAEVDGRFGLDALTLRLRVGIAGGELILQHIGGARRRHFVATGEPIRRVGLACARAERGAVVLDHDGFELPANLRIEPLDRPDLVRIFTSDGTWPDPVRPRPLELGPLVLDRLANYVPEPVRARRQLGSAATSGRFDLHGWTSELREVSVLFVGVLDRRRPSGIPAARAIAELVADIDATLAELEGNLEQVVMDDKGLVMVAAFGLPPRSHEDDPARAVRAGLAILDIGSEAGVELSVGITTGRVFCGAWGHPSRLHYTMVGAAVNWAARLMQSGQGILVDRETSVRAGRRFEFESLAAIEVKGSEVPLEVARPRASTGASTSGSFAARSLIGRVDELAVIERELDRMRAGEGPAVVIVGEAGIGKTRLLRSAIAGADRRGLRARIGAGDTIDASAALAAWRPIFAELLELGPTPDVERLQRELGELDEVRRLFPLLAAVVPIDLPDNAQTAAMDPQLRRETTRNVLAAVLADRLVPGRDLIVIEDAHWLDSASWALLDALRRACPEIGVLVTMRPVELERGELASTDLDRLRAGARELMLGPLAAEHATALAAAVLEVDQLPARVATLIAERSGGHPLFAEELGHALRDSGLLIIDSHRCRLRDEASDLAALNFPDRAHSLITSRLDALAPEQLIVAKVASVIGRSFERSLVAAIDPLGLASATLDEALDALVGKARLLVREGEARYAFRHALIHEAAYAMTAFAQRRELHAKLAAELEGRGLAADPVHAAVLAHHWRRGEDFVRCARELERAADHALRRGAAREAARFLCEVVSLCEQHPVVGVERDTLALARIERRIGEAYWALGSPNEADGYVGRALARIERQAPKTTGGWRRRLLLELTVQLGHLLASPRWVRRRNPEHVVRERAAAEVVGLAGMLRFHMGDMLAWLTHTLGAVNRAERADAHAAAARAYGSLAYLAGLARRHQLVERYLGRARLSEDPGLAADTDFAEGLHHLGYGRLDRAIALFEVGLDRARNLGDRVREGSGHTLLATGWSFKGHYPRGRDHFELLARIGEAEANARQLMWARAGLASVCWIDRDLDRVAETLALARESLEAAGDDGDRAAWFGLVAGEGFACLRRGDRSTAQRQLAEALAMWSGVPKVFSLLGPLDQLCELAILLGDRPLARRAVRALAGWARTFPVGRSRLLLHEANLALLERKLAGAEARADAAATLAEGQGLGWEPARIELTRAGLARARGLAIEPALARAEAGFAALDMGEQHAVLVELVRTRWAS